MLPKRELELLAKLENAEDEESTDVCACAGAAFDEAFPENELNDAFPLPNIDPAIPLPLPIPPDDILTFALFEAAPGFEKIDCFLTPSNPEKSRFTCA